MREKGFINLLELIIVAIVLFAAFTILFPRASYKSGWDYAQLLLRGRDVVLTVDALGKTYEYSFDKNSFDSFLSKLFSGTNFLVWSTTDDAIKNKIKIACVCSGEQIQTLTNWLKNVRINGRDINFVIYQSSLTSIAPSDVMLIWGYRDLSPYRSSIENYLTTAGIVEIMDFTTTVDDVQESIFGITNGGGWGNAIDSVVKPGTAKQLTYQSYKLFYHLPYALKATEDAELTTVCIQSNKTGNFTIRNLIRKFWICDSSSVYFDTDGDGVEDTGALYVNDTFTIDGFNFKLAYIDSSDKIRVVFMNRPEYEFADFIRASAIERIKPSNDDYSRVLIYRTNPEPEKACGVILNNISGSTAWIADFTRDGFDVGDDLKLLLTSLLLWASNKEESVSITNLRIGYVTSFVNVEDKDVFEIYKLDFGLGYPY